MITENVSTLKIHKLTQEQYDTALAAGSLDENAIYLTPNSTGSLADEVTIGLDENGSFYVKDGSIDVDKIEDVQALRNEMGLGNTLSALPVANGGTGATTAAAARTNLGITPANIGAAAADHTHDGIDVTSLSGVWVAGSGTPYYTSTVYLYPPTGTSVSDWTYVKFSCTFKVNSDSGYITTTIFTPTEIAASDYYTWHGFSMNAGGTFQHIKVKMSVSSSKITVSSNGGEWIKENATVFAEFMK